jgi:hypothetical protein
MASGSLNSFDDSLEAVVLHYVLAFTRFKLLLSVVLVASTYDRSLYYYICKAIAVFNISCLIINLLVSGIDRCLVCALLLSLLSPVLYLCVSLLLFLVLDFGFFLFEICERHILDGLLSFGSASARFRPCFQLQPVLICESSCQVVPITACEFFGVNKDCVFTMCFFKFSLVLCLDPLYCFRLPNDFHFFVIFL